MTTNGGLAGTWKADKGIDVNPKAEGSERRIFIEHTRMDPIDPQTNGPQLFYGLRYHIHINTPEEDITFHDQVGYWLYEPATGLIMQSLAIPRGQAALALWNQRPEQAAACMAAAAPRPGPSAPGCDEPLSGYKALQSSNEAALSWVSLHPNDPLMWSLLAQGEEAMGQRLRAMRAQAESRAALGDINGAVDRLRAAQALARTGGANDFIEASVVDARLRQLEATRREIAAEMRNGR